MRPVPIPDNEVWPGCRRIIMQPPDGDLTNDKVRAVEMLYDHTAADGIERIHCMMVLEEGDLELLQQGGRVWLTFLGVAIAPFMLTVTPKMVNGDASATSEEN